MTSTSAERVALILDCLGHEDTELTGQPRLWRHRDGRYVTEDEAAMVEKSTLGEIRRAMDLWGEEVDQLRERADLIVEFRAIIDPYRAHGDVLLSDLVARLPETKRERAIEIWQRLAPSFDAWQLDQS
jgi:hypothetical protein